MGTCPGCKRFVTCHETAGEPDARTCSRCGHKWINRPFDIPTPAVTEAPPPKPAGLSALAAIVPWWLRNLDGSFTPVQPAAETRSAEDYEEAAWDQAFRDEVGPIMAAKNAKWEAYGRGEHVPGARPLLGASFSGGSTVQTNGEDMYISNVNQYAPPGGKLLRSDVEADGTIRHTFAKADGEEVSCAIMAPHSPERERECLEAFRDKYAAASTLGEELAGLAADIAAQPGLVEGLLADPEDDIPEG